MILKYKLSEVLWSWVQKFQALVYLLQVIRTDDIDVQIIESFVIMSPEIETEEKESESTPNPIFHFKDKTHVFSSNYQISTLIN